MILETPISPEFELGRGHGHKPRTRTDIASGEAMDPAHMIRVGFSPDGEVVADIFGKLPGRGAWVAASRDAVEKAVKTNAFTRAAKRKITVPDAFANIVEKQLLQKILGLIGMANRAGQLESGFDKVRSMAQTGTIAFRLEASDGAEDGRSKIRVIDRAVARELEQAPAPVIGCFSCAELGKVLGRDHMVHLAVRKGKLAKSLHAEISRLVGFRTLVPDNWTDKEHESVFVPFS